VPILEERVLLQELNHRISNEFRSAISLVSLAAARSGNNEVKVALTGSVTYHYAEVHQALMLPQQETRIDTAGYLRNLCLSIKRSKLDQLEIDLAFAADPLVRQSMLLGMVVHELITNAAPVLPLIESLGCKVSDCLTWIRFA
jgi:two-component sensor histidine kinase